MTDTTDEQKLQVLRDEVDRLSEENEQLRNENARLNGQTYSESGLVTELRAEIDRLEQALGEVRS